MAEYEEQLRVNYWHKMILHNPAHKRALTIIDERALPPLLITQPEFDPSEDNDCDTKKDDGVDEHTESESAGFSNGARDDAVALCPLIERGLDRLWLAHSMGQDFSEWSQDAMESISCQAVLSIPLAMARLQEERKLLGSSFSS
eukprot:14999541-Ditylum_brightwellii.AAC.1